MYAERLGAERALAAQPVRRDGRPPACRSRSGSDSPVTPLDPWGAVRAAAHHHAPASVTSVTAFAAHTTRRLAGRPR